MVKNMCDFCKNNKPIKHIDNNNHYYFSLPFSSKTLVITDKKKSREYLYGITYCPICGNILYTSPAFTDFTFGFQIRAFSAIIITSKGLKLKNKKCKLCEKQKLNFTSPGSNNKAEVFMQGRNYLTFYGDDSADYILKCNYCPKCGKKLII